MAAIDAHQHFWKYNPVHDEWITDEMAVIKKDFSPDDLSPLLEQNGFDGCIAVQADQSEEENSFLLNYAGQYEFIKGIVGWVDLQSGKIEERLKYYSSFKKMKGFRHVLQGEKQRDLMLKPEFMNGINKLEQYGFTYDILIFADQLKYIPGFVAAFPNQRFVVDHIAKPDIKNKKIDDWRKEITAVAEYEHVYCKISGMITEADWRNWKQEDLDPYLDVIVNAFGTKRIMFGSDWPVCLLSGSYHDVVAVVRNYFSSFSQHEQELFFRENAVQFYKLD